MEELNLVEATIEDLQAALSCGAVSSVELVAQYLRRICVYDCRGIALNAVPILNENVFAEAAASDDRRTAGLSIRPLEGIPFTVKDSYKVKGMTVASGSPAFKDLIANEDAFTVATLRAAGGVLIGKTNMPAMAAGGMQRGIYGRAESPYNLSYLAAAFASGSSNGSAVATAASFASFGMGEETVSSGRSPASNNALVAYTPSRGWLSIRGNWPLYPTCDVVVPHTRSMRDMLTLVEVLAHEDQQSQGDFWREQPFVKLAKPWSRGAAGIREVSKCNSLAGVRIAVPELYVGGKTPPGARPVFTSDGVVALWAQAKQDLESLGAEVIYVPDFPVVTAYESPELLPHGSPRLPQGWGRVERGQLVAHGWNQFLLGNKDPKLPNLASIDGLQIYPQSMRTPAELKQMDMVNAIDWAQLPSYAKNTNIWDTEGLESALLALEGLRKVLLDDYLAQYRCQCFVFPAAGDVGAANADEDDIAAAHAWRNGVHYSNGNRALRHLGIPTVTVPMGMLQDKKMPVGLTFAGRTGDDINLLKWAFAYEQKTQRRVTPPLTPPLESDRIPLEAEFIGITRVPRPEISVQIQTELPVSDAWGRASRQLRLEGVISVRIAEEIEKHKVSIGVTITVDGLNVPSDQIKLSQPSFHENGKAQFILEAHVLTEPSIEKDARSKSMVPVTGDKTTVVVLARSAPGGRSSGWLGLVDQ